MNRLKLSTHSKLAFNVIERIGQLLRYGADVHVCPYDRADKLKPVPIGGRNIEVRAPQRQADGDVYAAASRSWRGSP
jgi:hypothetical protein